MLLLILLIVGLVIVLIYKPRSSPPPPMPPESENPPDRPSTDPAGSVADAIAGTAPWIRPPSVPGYGGVVGAMIGDDEERSWGRKRR